MTANENEAHDVVTSQVINVGVARLPGYTGNHHVLELHTLASIFISDAEALGNRATVGQYVLAAHGIELALKSYLHEKGISVKVLSLPKYGHNLTVLMAKAREFGLVTTNRHTDNIIDRLQEYMRKAKIRYDITFQLPLITDVIQVARSLLESTQPTLPGSNANDGASDPMA